MLLLNAKVISPHFKKHFQVLENLAPTKKKIVRANQVPYMTKTLRKAIMTRSRLQNKYHKMKTEECFQNFKRQRNFCNRLYKRERKRFYSNLNPQSLFSNKKFWTNIKPFFSDKGNTRNEITLVEKNEIISDNSKVATTLNSFFENAVTTLGIPTIDHHLTDTSSIEDPIDKIITKFAKHPSILRINNNVQKGTFIFQIADFDEVHTEISKLKTKVACASNSISSSLLKENIEVCSEYLMNIINFGITTSSFDDGMKLADITPIFKRDETILKENYRPISCLPAGSKIFERILQKQMNSYIETILSLLCSICSYDPSRKVASVPR